MIEQNIDAFDIITILELREEYFIKKYNSFCINKKTLEIL